MVTVHCRLTNRIDSVCSSSIAGFDRHLLPFYCWQSNFPEVEEEEYTRKYVAEDPKLMAVIFLRCMTCVVAVLVARPLKKPKNLTGLRHSCQCDGYGWHVHE